MAFWPSAIAAILVGVVLALACRWEYACTATMRITGPASEARVTDLRKELLYYVWNHTADAGQAGVEPGAWFVDSPGPSLLRLTLVTSKRRRGVECARQLAEGYQEQVRAKAASARETPGEAEHLLAAHASDLRTRVAEARAQIDSAVATIPNTDPSARRNALLERWQRLRSDFDTTREELSRAASDVTRLQQEPEPTYGVVSAERRREALEADRALQQDLRELAVNLTELKLHLLNVWQQSAGPLERLTLAVHDMIDRASSDRRRSNVEEATAKLKTLVGATEAYRDMVKAFARAWTREFTAIRQLQIDPYSGEVLDRYEHVRRKLNDFLFEASKRLTSVRLQVRAVSTDPRDAARHYVFESNLVRSFQVMQTAHHRFEFAAGAVETPDNFRLDAALKAARGLRRRSQDRIEEIERKLQAEAARNARRRRLRELTDARRRAEQLRTAGDRALDDLIALQDELNLSAGQAEAFLRSIIRIETAAARLELARADLAETEAKLAELVARRKTAADNVDTDVVSFGASYRPVNLTELVGIGALGAVLALIAVGAVQIAGYKQWITKRGGSRPGKVSS